MGMERYYFTFDKSGKPILVYGIRKDPPELRPPLSKRGHASHKELLALAVKNKFDENKCKQLVKNVTPLFKNMVGELKKTSEKTSREEICKRYIHRSVATLRNSEKASTDFDKKPYHDNLFVEMGLLLDGLHYTYTELTVVLNHILKNTCHKYR